MVKTAEINVKTRGNCEVVNVTDRVQEAVAGSGIVNGAAVLWVVGSTAGLTTTEYEPGLVNHDLAAAYEHLAPRDATYQHEETWHDDNGHAHVCASLLGPSLNVPIVDGQLTVGTWQQIVLIDFDTRGRTRKIICQLIGE